MRFKLVIILTCLFIFGYFLRVMFLSQHILTFGYDQARDAVQSLSIAHGDLKVLGPPSSTPGLFHGVLYYYILAPLYLFGKGSPIVAAYGIAFLNTLTICLVFSLSYLFTKTYKAAILAAFFYGISFESTQYATWLSNPTIAIFTVPLLYLGIWLWVSRKNIWGLFFAAIGLGFSIQAEIFLAYHFVPLLYWFWTVRKSFSKRLVVLFCGSFLLSISTMILVEVKFGFHGISGFLSLLSTSDAIVSSKGFGDIVLLYLNQIGKVFALNSYASNIGYGSAIVFLLLLFIYKTKDKKKTSPYWLYFLATWLFSHITVVSLGGVSTPFLLVGIGPAVSILLGCSLSLLYKKYGVFLPLVLTAAITFSSISMIMKENSRGSTLFSIQKDMLLSKELAAIDTTYIESQNGPFSINTLTSPLWVNIVWAYLYSWYGQSHYGYMPHYSGRDQVGQVIALPQSSYEKVHYSLVEPLAGIPSQYYPDFLNQENAHTQLLREFSFGEILLQKRQSNGKY